MPLKRKEAFIISAVITDTQTTEHDETATADQAAATVEPTANTEQNTDQSVGQAVGQTDDQASDQAADQPTKTFRDLGVDERIAEALAAGGILTPFPIQAATIPVALTGADVIGQAKTGTGKTLAFGIPVLQRMTLAGGNAAAQATTPQSLDAIAAAVAPAVDLPAPRGRNGRRGPAKSPVSTGPKMPGRPLALIVVPTRELAVQVTEDLASAGKVMAARVLSVYGGRAYEPQIAALAAGIDIVVGTPGRLLDLNKQGHLDLSAVGMLVLDEADEMLDLGFLPDVERIVTQLPATRQTLLFSATMPGQVIALARQYMSRPTHIRAADPHDSGSTVTNVTQHVYRAHALDKTEMLAKMLQAEGRGLTMVFCRTKRTAAKVAEELDERGYASAAVHGDLGQGAREQALRAFRNGKVDVLVATDVAARGIDVEGVTHVVNFQCPDDEKTYLHRIGRTARAGASGTAVTFVDWDEVPRWNLINKALGLSFHEPPETYSTSESFHSDLKIPAGSKGRLLKADQTRAGLSAEVIEDLGETGRGAGARQRPGAASGSGRGDRPERGERGGERPARPKRERTRTRGAQRAGGVTTEGAENAEAVVDAISGERAERSDRPKRSRTRTRGAGKGAENGATEVLTAESPAAEPAAVEAAPAENADQPKRTRTRKSALATAMAAEPAVIEALATVTPVAEEKPKRTRTRKAADAPADAAPAVETAAVVETPATDATDAAADKPKRTRTAKKATAPAEAKADAAADQPKRARTRKAGPAGLTATGEAVTGNYNS